MKLGALIAFGALASAACGSTIDVGGVGSAGAPGDGPGSNAGAANTGNAGAPGTNAGAPGTNAGAPGTNAGAPGTNAGAPGNEVYPTCSKTTPLPAWPASNGCAGSNDLPIVGSWQGYVENAGAPWDALTLEIEGANESGLCGTIKIGSGPEPAPFSDPVPAPGISSPGTGPKPFPGAKLTLLSGTTDGTRVRFTVAQTQPYKSWCEQQISYGPGSELCGCVPNWAAHGDGDGACVLTDAESSNEYSTTCQKLSLCSPGGTGACSCNATGCTASQALTADFDLRVNGNTAEGTDSTHPGVRLHFTRSP